MDLANMLMPCPLWRILPPHDQTYDDQSKTNYISELGETPNEEIF